jgi:hypothetical protein
MKAFFDELHDNYDILNLSYEDLIELNKVLDSCQLPQKRNFYSLKKDIEKHIASRRLPRKK